MLGMSQIFTWGIQTQLTSSGNATSMDVNSKMYIKVPPIAISELPSLWAWVFKLTNVS